MTHIQAVVVEVFRQETTLPASDSKWCYCCCFLRSSTNTQPKGQIVSLLMYQVHNGDMKVDRKVFKLTVSSISNINLRPVSPVQACGICSTLQLLLHASRRRQRSCTGPGRHLRGQRVPPCQRGLKHTHPRTHY